MDTSYPESCLNAGESRGDCCQLLPALGSFIWLTWAGAHTAGYSLLLLFWHPLFLFNPRTDPNWPEVCVNVIIAPKGQWDHVSMRSLLLKDSGNTGIQSFNLGLPDH